jgi:hypothetical protein
MIRPTPVALACKERNQPSPRLLAEALAPWIARAAIERTAREQVRGSATDTHSTIHTVTRLLHSEAQEF